MPSLTWDSKSLQQPDPVYFETDSLIFPHGVGYPGVHPQNELFMGDNLAVMAGLLPEWEGRIDLIYADPPFFTNRPYLARVGRGEDSRRPREWEMAEGYLDNWASLDAYLDMLYSRLHLMHRLLAPSGSLYLHLDWHANAYARLLLDEIFGPEQVLNEIIWAYHGPSPIRSAFNRKHDTILVYTKGKKYTFNADAVRQPYDPNTVKTFESSSKAGFGKVPNLERGKVPEDWWYFPVVARLHSERTGYPTQKPEALLERIVLASSNPGDVVADFFCGSGTTAVVAARQGRRFIASDITWRAVMTTRSRLAASACPPFRIQHIAGAPLPEKNSSRRYTISVSPNCQAITILAEPDHLDRLDYWEIDPNWDGKVFHSAAQAVRPRRNKAITHQLEIPLPAGNQIAVRLVGVVEEILIVTENQGKSTS